MGFADVKNHLTTPALRERMGTDLFIYHGFSELYLERKWVKATGRRSVTVFEGRGARPGLERDQTGFLNCA